MVDQSNSVDSSATAANLNLTKQDADQDQGGSGGLQLIGQEAKSDQEASALSLATQKDATNTNIPVRVLSKGDNGSVEQSNSVDSSATAANLNALKQDADQDQGGKGDKCCTGNGIQAIGQEAKNEQDATRLVDGAPVRGQQHEHPGPASAARATTATSRSPTASTPMRRR